MVTHGFPKHTYELASEEINKAVKLKIEYQRDPESHTVYWEGP